MCPAPSHGTQYAYKIHRCRCPESLAAMRKYWRSVSARRPRGSGRHAPRVRDPEVDEVAVERAMHGDRVQLTVRERGLVVERLTAAGMSAVQIGLRLGMTSRAVVRYRVGQIVSARDRDAA